MAKKARSTERLKRQLLGYAKDSVESLYSREFAEHSDTGTATGLSLTGVGELKAEDLGHCYPLSDRSIDRALDFQQAYQLAFDNAGRVGILKEQCLQGVATSASRDQVKLCFSALVEIGRRCIDEGLSDEPNARSEGGDTSVDIRHILLEWLQGELEALADLKKEEGISPDDIIRVARRLKDDALGELCDAFFEMRAERDGIDLAKQSLVSWQEHIVGVGAAADALGLSRESVKKFAQNGDIGVKIDGRYLFSLAELAAFGEIDRPTGIHREKRKD